MKLCWLLGHSNVVGVGEIHRLENVWDGYDTLHTHWTVCLDCGEIKVHFPNLEGMGYTNYTLQELLKLGPISCYTIEEIKAEFDIPDDAEVRAKPDFYLGENNPVFGKWKDYKPLKGDCPK